MERQRGREAGGIEREDKRNCKNRIRWRIGEKQRVKVRELLRPHSDKG